MNALTFFKSESTTVQIINSHGKNSSKWLVCGRQPRQCWAMWPWRPPNLSTGLRTGYTACPYSHNCHDAPSRPCQPAIWKSEKVPAERPLSQVLDPLDLQALLALGDELTSLAADDDTNPSSEFSPSTQCFLIHRVPSLSLFFNNFSKSCQLFLPHIWLILH